MRLDTARLHNWCQHRDTTVDFQAGLNGILGANGNGKSNLLDAVRFAFTGESVNAGNKADNVTWGEKDGWVEIDFTVGDTTYTLRRAIAAATVKLTYAGEKITKAGEVGAFLQRLLGAGTKTLKANVFIQQGQIDSILLDLASDRLAEFQRTFGLDRAEEGYRALAKEATLHPITPDLDQHLQQAVQLVLDARTEQTRVHEQVSTIQQRIAELEPSEALLHRVLEATRTQAAIREANLQVERAEQDVTARLNDLGAAKAALENADAVVQQGAGNATIAEQQIRLIEQASIAWERAQQLRVQLSAMKAQRATLPAPMDPTELAGLRQQVQIDQEEVRKIDGWFRDDSTRPRVQPELDAAINLQRARFDLEQASKPIVLADQPEELARAQHIARLVSELGSFESGICPTCLQPVHGGPEAANQRKTELAELRAQQAAWTARITGERQQAVQLARQKVETIEAELKSFASAFVTWAKDQQQTHALQAATRGERIRTAEQTIKQVDELERQTATQAQMLEGLPVDAPDLTHVAAMRQYLADYQSAVTFARDARSTAQVAAGSHKNTVDQLDRVRAMRDSLGQAVAMPTEAEVEAAKQACTELPTRRAELADATQQTGVIRALLEQREAEARRLTALSTKEADDQAWMAVVKRCRDILHVTNFPALVMREYARLLNVQIAYYLGIWESPFRMWLDDSLEFQMEFIDGLKKGFKGSAKRLSGGERVVASASFRLAMSDTFARQVGMLVLDEPSNHLDEENKKLLAKLLLKLKELSRHTGRQILIVTHEGDLLSCLDHVVTV